MHKADEAGRGTRLQGSAIHPVFTEHLLCATTVLRTGIQWQTGPKSFPLGTGYTAFGGVHERTRVMERQSLDSWKKFCCKSD